MKAEHSEFCNNKLFSLLPELLNDPKYQSIIKDALKDQRLSAHGIYEDALCPFVFELIHKKDKESKKTPSKNLQLN